MIPKEAQKQLGPYKDGEGKIDTKTGLRLCPICEERPIFVLRGSRFICGVCDGKFLVKIQKEQEEATKKIDGMIDEIKKENKKDDKSMP